MEKSDFLLTLSATPLVKIIAILQTVIFTVFLPFFIIYHDFNDIFEKLDLLKLLILSAAIGSVCYAILFTMVGLFIGLSDNRNEEFNFQLIIPASTFVINFLLSLVVFVWITAGLIQAVLENHHRTLAIFGLGLATFYLTFISLMFSLICENRRANLKKAKKQ